VIASALLALAALSTPPVPDPEPQEIVVVGRLVEQVQLTLGRDAQGRNVCSLNRSSGNARIDDAVCRRATRCTPRRPVSQARTEACIADARRWVVRQWSRAQR